MACDLPRAQRPNRCDLTLGLTHQPQGDSLLPKEAVFVLDPNFSLVKSFSWQVAVAFLSA